MGEKKEAPTVEASFFTFGKATVPFPEGGLSPSETI
jgi:hypothetical protein